MSLRISSDEELKTIFVSSCIETVANHLECSASDVYLRMQRVGFIEGYIWKYYDTLHTQSREYVLDDVLEALNNWEKVKITNNKAWLCIYNRTALGKYW